MAAGSINYQTRVPWLHGKGYNVYTQFGEDGLIEACLSKIGETNRQCFEIGASDGRFFSNTLRLREQGWQAVLIESEPLAFQKLVDAFGQQSTCLHMRCDSLDEPLTQAGLCSTPDLGVIDIDGQDYWLWHDMKLFHPRIMLVEISTSGIGYQIPNRGEPYPAQAGLIEIEQLGKAKGYTLVATTFCNALFVRDECLQSS